MTIADISDPEAVRKAVREFDRRGRAGFLDQYGFGAARRYFLLIDGKRYDSKAIVGAAHGYQFPGRGALNPEDFSGGDATVRRKLEELGFEVEDLGDAGIPGPRTGDGYWVFVCNPKRWAIDRFFATGVERDAWGVRKSDAPRFAPGQLAVVRVGIDGRNKEEREGRPKLEAGIYALCVVESTASARGASTDSFWSPDEVPAADRQIVDIRYLRTFLTRPLTIARLKEERPTLSPHVLNGLQASSFPISEGDFRLILDLLGEEADDLRAAPPVPPSDMGAVADLERKYRDAVPEVREAVSKSIERGPVGALVKKANGFKCKLGEALGAEPIGFKKPNGEPYVEAHHVMPVSRGVAGSLAASNILTLCANHHRQMHYGGIAVTATEASFEIVLPTGLVRVARVAVGSG